ncbi:MAG: DUF4249 domain-containing protein [Bacteroidota bacterium]|nr:hypothetical protein [Odoribacter sp.]MDP3643381.1 DUF4249 domain-containing protein [Bacteroidota bacterium]
MIRKYIQLLLFTILLISCTKYIEFSPPYEGNKIVVNGYISLTEGAKIKITHSINPVGNYLWADSLLVKDAFAALYENGVKLIDLKYAGKGYYGLPASPAANLIAGHRYKLVVQTELYGNAESEEITLPEQPKIKDFKFSIIGEVYGSGAVNGLFSFSISEPTEKESCFSIQVVTKNNERQYFQHYPRTEGRNYFESCEAYAGGVSIYSNECGYTNQLHQYCVGLGYDENRQISNYYKPMVIKIGSVSRELYEYAKSYSQLDGMEFGFAEPPILKSNIKGGYGLLYGSNTISFPIKLP